MPIYDTLRTALLVQYGAGIPVPKYADYYDEAVAFRFIRQRNQQLYRQPYCQNPVDNTNVPSLGAYMRLAYENGLSSF
jgi:hypothetical protein|uniref:Uncharacterized protein n=1 Tax=viral metagenome TaxID=1070528 RepID=A0A6C0K418_9ZZZZ